MSENKDLEIIKQNEPYRRIDFEDYKVGFDSIKWRAVIEAAERMVAEIARLKAELEKRPEIITCGECKLRGTDNCWLAEIDDTDDEYETFWEPQTDDNDFCSHGQRRESEEGK